MNQETEITTEVFDTGRRGAPLPGCDCVQCFGYCFVNQDVEYRERAEARGELRAAVAEGWHLVAKTNPENDEAVALEGNGEELEIEVC
jgi:hypothetical protein